MTEYRLKDQSHSGMQLLCSFSSSIAVTFLQTLFLDLFQRYAKETMSIYSILKKWNNAFSVDDARNPQRENGASKGSPMEASISLNTSREASQAGKRVQDCINLFLRFKENHKEKELREFGPRPFDFFFGDFDTRIFLVASTIGQKNRTVIEIRSQNLLSELDNMATKSVRHSIEFSGVYFMLLECMLKYKRSGCVMTDLQYAIV